MADQKMEQRPLSVDDLERVFDGDSGETVDGDGFRAEGYDAFETPKPERLTGHPISGLSKEALDRVLDGGGTVNPTGRKDKYQRDISTVRDSEGEDVSLDMIESGLAMPTTFNGTTSRDDQAQAEMTSIARQAMGMSGTDREEFKDLSDQAFAVREQASWRPFTDNPNIRPEFFTRDKRGTFEKSWDRGVATAKASAGGFLNWLGDATGNDEWVEKGKRITFDSMLDAQGAAREVDTYKDIDNLDDAVTYLVETTGELAPQVLMDAATLVAGAGVGGVTAMTLRKAGMTAMTNAARNGALSMTALNSFAQGTGNMENVLESRGSEVNTGAAAVSGAASAVIDTAPIAAVLPRFGRAAGLSGEAVNKTLSALDRVKDIAATTLIGAGAEGASNLAQGIIDKVIEAEAMGDDGWDINSEEAIDDMIRGVLGGGAATTLGSGMSHAAGAMMEYNAARKSVDAEGNKRNKDGWLVDENGEILTEAVEPETKDDGASPIDAKPTVKHSDIPDLKSKDYHRVARELMPDGVPITWTKLNTKISEGNVTADEIIRYLADNATGKSNPIYGSFYNDNSKYPNRPDFKAEERLADALRDGKINNDTFETISDALTGSWDKLREKTDAAGPAVTKLVYEPSYNLDWKRMWNEFYDSHKSDKTLAEKRDDSAKQKAGEVDVPSFEVGEPVADKPVVSAAPDRPLADQTYKTPQGKPMTKAQRFASDLLVLSKHDSEMKTVLDYFNDKSNRAKDREEAYTYLVRRVDEYRDEENRIAKGIEPEAPTVSLPERATDTGDERSVGDVQQASESGLDYFTPFGEETSDTERQANRKGFTRQVSNLFAQLNEIEGVDTDAAKSTFNYIMNSYVGSGWKQMASEAKGNNSHPYRIVSDADGINRDKVGDRPVRALKKQSIEKLNRLMSEGQYSSAVEHLTELGVFAPGHVVGEMPKVTRDVRLKQYERDAGYKKRAVDVVSTVDGKKFVAETLVRDHLGMANSERGAKKHEVELSDMDSQGLNPTDIGLVSDEVSASKQLADALTSAVGELAEHGYDVDVRNLPSQLVVYRDPGNPNKNMRRVTLGDLRERLRRSNTYRDQMNKGKPADADGVEGYGSFLSDALFDSDDSDNLRKLDKEGSDTWSSIDENERNSGMYSEFDGRETAAREVDAGSDADDAPKIPYKSKDTGTIRKELREAKKLVRTVKRKRGAARSLLLKLVRSIDSRIRNIHPEIADMVQTFTLDTQGYVSKFISKMDDVGSNKTIQRGYEDAIAGRDTTAAKKYLAWLAHVDAEIQTIDPNHKPHKGPRVHLDLDKIDKHRAGFNKVLAEAGVKDPSAFTEKLFDGDGVPEWARSLDADNQVKATSAILTKAGKKLREAGFLDNDAPRHLTRYAHAAARHMAWEANMRKDGKFEKLMSEVHPINVDELQKLMDGVTGLNARGTPRWLRNANSVTLAFNTATILWFSAVASIPELAGVVARSRGDVDGLQNDFKKLLTGVGRDELRAFAKDYGVIGGEVTQHALQQLFAMDEATVGRMSQRIQNRVFQLNGQHWLTQLNRALAASAAKRFMDYHAASGTERSKRMLAELDIDADTIRAYLKDGKLDSTEGRAYTRALHRFVNQAVTNPRPDQLPLIATDPRYAMVTSLKKFFYGFYHNVNKGLMAEYRAGRIEGDASRAAIAMALTAATVVPLAMLAEWLREFLKYPLGRPDSTEPKSTSEYMMQVLGATGMFGPLHMAQLPAEMSQYGKSAFAVGAGPTASYIDDVLNGRAKFSRHVPVASQLPWLGKPLDKAVKETFDSSQ